MSEDHRVPTVSDRPLDLDVAALLGDLGDGDWVAVEWGELHTLLISCLKTTATASGEIQPHRALARLAVLLAGSGTVHKVRRSRPSRAAS